MKLLKLFVILTTLATSITGCNLGGGGGGGTGTSSLPGSDPVNSIGPISGLSSDNGIVSDSSSDLSVEAFAQDDASPHANPEPSTMVLLGIGVAGLVTASLRKKKH